MIKYFDKDPKDYNIFYNNVNTSIAISAAITAAARTFMHPFILNNRILYTDTDSVHVIGNFPDKFIGNKLGLFKLERIYKEAIFIAPKVYSGILEDNSQISKVKGYKHSVHFNEFKKFLNKDFNLILNKIKLKKKI